MCMSPARLQVQTSDDQDGPAFVQSVRLYMSLKTIFLIASRSAGGLTSNQHVMQSGACFL